MKDIDETKAPLLDHLVELRGRLLKCVWALFITGAICFYFSQHIFAFLVHPLKEAFGNGGGRLPCRVVRPRDGPKSRQRVPPASSGLRARRKIAYN